MLFFPSITFLSVAECLPVASPRGGNLITSLQLIDEPQRHLVVQMHGHPGGVLGVNLANIRDGLHMVPQSVHVPRETVLFLRATNV